MLSGHPPNGPQFLETAGWFAVPTVLAGFPVWGFHLSPIVWQVFAGGSRSHDVDGERGHDFDQRRGAPRKVGSGTGSYRVPFKGILAPLG